MDNTTFLLKDAWQQLDKSVSIARSSRSVRWSHCTPARHHSITTRSLPGILFIRALVFRFNREHQIVRNFLSVTADLHGRKRRGITP